MSENRSIVDIEIYDLNNDDILFSSFSPYIDEIDGIFSKIEKYFFCTFV
jgi:hypothetical protein